MNKFLLFILLFFYCFVVYSQSETTIDSTVIRKSGRIEISNDPLLYQESIKEINIKPEEIEVKDSITDSGYTLQPTLDSNPLKLPDKLTYSLNEYEYNYGIGQYHEGRIEISYKPMKKFSLYSGVSGVHYNILHSRYKDIVFDFNAIYQFNSLLQLSVFGQYSINSDRNERFGGYMFSPQNTYGAELNIRLSDNLDLSLRRERVLNPMTRKWENNTVLAPAFRFK